MTLRRATLALLILAAVAVYAFFGFFTVAADEEAVVLRIGRYARTLGPGLQWRALGIERFESRRVTSTIEEEFGYRTIDAGPPPEYEDRPAEKRMLSGDANIVNVEFVVQYRIADLRKFLFSVNDPSRVVRDASLAAMREVVAEQPIDDVLTAAKGPIEEAARQSIQNILDSYDAGVRIQNVRLQDVEPPEAVKEAFADVASAEQDRERMILEAQGYADQILPRARGQAQETLNQAQGYRESRILTAQGEARRFSALLVEYEKAPRVTRERLYLETLEAILPGMEKVLLDRGNAEAILPYLPLGRRGIER